MAKACCGCQATPAAGAPRFRGVLPYLLAGVSGGLLCSTCCLVQLFMNYLSLGCAGFAALKSIKILQPSLRALTYASLAHMLFSKGVTKSTVITLLVSVLITHSEDAVRLYNRSVGTASFAALPSLNNPSLGSNTPLAPHHAEQEQQVHQQQARERPQHSTNDQLELVALEYGVSGIKCEGCAMRLKQRVLSVPGVVQCTVNYASGRVRVWASNTSEGLRSAVMSTIQLTDLSYRVRLIHSGNPSLDSTG